MPQSGKGMDYIISVRRCMKTEVVVSMLREGGESECVGGLNHFQIYAMNMFNAPKHTCGKSEPYRIVLQHCDALRNTYDLNDYERVGSP